LEASNRDLTATSEILRVISTSPADARPVFDAIVKNAVRLCEARFGAVFRLDGGLVHLAAHHNFSEALLARWFHTFYPMAPNRGHVSGRTILSGAAVQVPDILADDQYLGAGMKASGFRRLLGVPLLRDGRAIGAIVIYRAEPGQFANKHIELLQTFADQAVIAIENVRLFNETKEALEQQSASGEVLAAISSSIADTKPVFEKILQSCERLFAGTFITINVLNDDGLLQAAAHHGPKREEYLKSDQPSPIDETTATRICMTRRSMLHFPDIEEPRYRPAHVLPAVAAVFGRRSSRLCYGRARALARSSWAAITSVRSPTRRWRF
jgi:GAF domain-containing protein